MWLHPCKLQFMGSPCCYKLCSSSHLACRHWRGSLLDDGPRLHQEVRMLVRAGIVSAEKNVEVLRGSKRPSITVYE